MEADAEVPPARPPMFWGTGGLAVPPAGAAPPAPRLGNVVVVVLSPGAAGGMGGTRFLACPRRHRGSRDLRLPPCACGPTSLGSKI